MGLYIENNDGHNFIIMNERIKRCFRTEIESFVYTTTNLQFEIAFRRKSYFGVKYPYLNKPT